MSWYNKVANTTNLTDRNILNAKIRRLEDICETLTKMSKLVVQTNRGAKEMAEQIMNNKRMSSYPKIREILSKADEIALDSPKKFSELCLIARDKLGLEIKKLEKERKDFIKSLEIKKEKE